MTHLTLASAVEPALRQPARQWAHDVRNVMQTISLHLNTLELLSGQHGVRAADAIHVLIDRVAAMCNDALTGAGSSATRRERVNVVQAVEHVAELVLATAPRSFRVEMSSADSVLAMVDAGDLFRILFNLFHNAVAVSRRNGALDEIAVRVEVNASTVSVFVADNGPGLPRAVRRRLFRPVGGTGSGLGLSIARELAELNGGSLHALQVTSGAAFRLDLPAFSTTRLADGATARPAGQLVSAG